MRSAPAADGKIFVLFLLLLVWAPVPLGSNRPWAAAILEVGIFALALAWIWLYALGRVHARAPLRRAWPAMLLFAIWLAWLAIQVVPLPVELVRLISPTRAQLPTPLAAPAMHTLSIDPYASLGFLLKSCAWVAAFCLTLALMHSRERLKTIAIVIVVAGTVQALLASFMHLAKLNVEVFFTAFSHVDNAHGTFVNRNHLAGYLEICLALGIGMMIATLKGGSAQSWKQRFRETAGWLLSTRVLLRISLIIMVIALVMTRSRMGNAAFFSSMLVAGVIGLATSRHATKSTVILLVSLIVIDIFVVGTWFGVENVIKRYEETTIYRELQPTGGSVEERLEPSLYAVDMIKDYPMTGSGGGTFYTAFPNYRPGIISAYFDFAHNDYVQLTTDTGAIGLGLLGLVVLWTFVVALRTLYERRDPLCRGIAFGTTMGIIAIMIHSWVDFNLQIPANAFTFIVLLALGWAAYSVNRRHSAINVEGRDPSSPQVEE
ncbi:MAG: O-antigen ligase family protein [Burkholderiales bacterium]|nr:O-antigen ligase family protein [Burkholderiales bacterium]